MYIHVHYDLTKIFLTLVGITNNLFSCTISYTCTCMHAHEIILSVLFYACQISINPFLRYTVLT